MVPPAITIETSAWETAENGFSKFFRLEGFWFSVVDPEGSFVKESSMKTLPGRFSLSAVTRSSVLNAKLLVWWELNGSSFRGETRLGDGDWDSRTICEDVCEAL